MCYNHKCRINGTLRCASFVEPSLRDASENEVHQILLRSPLLNCETCINTYIKDGTEQ